LIELLLVEFVLGGIFFIEFLVATDETGDFVVSIVAGAFETLVLSDKFGNVGIALVDLHLQSVDVFPEFVDGSAVDVGFGPS
jgi:hypothetical protein